MNVLPLYTRFIQILYLHKVFLPTYGVAKRLVSICQDCDIFEFENHEVKPRVITLPTVINAFEAICKVIKRSCEITSINYYEDVKMAHSESKEPRFNP